MKTASFNRNFVRRYCLAILIITFLMQSDSGASWNLSMDLDARLTDRDREDARGEINILGLSLRKTISDDDGDRLILFALFEARDDFAERMLHEVYARYKGPMGKWNVTFGRFGLPFGLLPGFTTSRLQYESLTPVLIDMDVDSGAMVSGVLGDFDYGIAVTQGYGGHLTPEFEGPDVVSGRLGVTVGDSGDFQLGVSALSGKVYSAHMEDHRIEHRIVSLDMTVGSGRWNSRMEIQTGEIDDRSISGAFAMIDYAILPKWDLTVAGRFTHHNQMNEGYGHVGLAYRAPWFTVRGGYTYDHSEIDDSIVSIQIYRMLAIPF